jgi:outer membrane protein assembly factor BamB
MIRPPPTEFLAGLLALGVLGGLALAKGWRRTAMAAGLAFAALALAATRYGGVTHGPPPPVPPTAAHVRWLWEAPERGGVVATPRVDGERLFVAAVQDAGLSSFGAVYCLGRSDKRVLWKFTDDGRMLHSISCPCVADGRVYFGEGMHANFVCKFRCLDATGGRKLWDFETAGHIESSPCVADGRVFFGSGDDGLYCLDAVTGQRRWQFRGLWHVDSSPLVAGGRVYFGSGLSRRFRTTAVLCLNAADGAVVWYVPTDLPVWGAPVLHGNRLFVPLGNGRLTKGVDPPEQPAGALLCLDAATGQMLWRRDLPDGVLNAPALDETRIFCGCRDGRCHAFDQGDGRPLWSADVGSPVVTSPAVAAGSVFAVDSTGRVVRLDAADGREVWRFDVAAHAQMPAQMFASPRAVVEDGRVRVYVAGELIGGVNHAAVVYCLEE